MNILELGNKHEGSRTYEYILTKLELIMTSILITILTVCTYSSDSHFNHFLILHNASVYMAVFNPF